MWSRPFCRKFAKELLFKYTVVAVVMLQSFEVLCSSFFGGMTLTSNNAEVSLGCQQIHKHNDTHCDKSNVPFSVHTTKA